MLIQVVRFWDRLPRPVQRGFGPALLALFLLIALSFVPAVSAHVPGMKTISRTVRKVLGLKPAPSFKKASAPKKSGQKRTQKTAPRTTQKAPPRVARETALKSTPKAAPKTAQKAAPKVAQKSAPAKAAATLPFTVKSTPSGATVQINGRAAGKTPVTVKLAAGTHKLTISRSGYAPVTRTVTVKKGVTASLTVKLAASSRASKPKAAATPAKVASSPAKRSPAPTNTAKLLRVGAQAPAITLKDSTGRVHRLGAFRGRKVVALFIWSLDAKAKALINELDSHVRDTGEDSALVILAGGDAAAARKYAESARLRVPLLLGGEETARSYGVPRGTIVLYVVSEFGTIAQREVNNIQLTPIFSRPRG
ncbi:MAG TPA: PEGA domain-containing protein [bacterium]|nr:PEGA domain-containing protein [bacterium]